MNLKEKMKFNKKRGKEKQKSDFVIFWQRHAIPPEIGFPFSQSHFRTSDEIARHHFPFLNFEIDKKEVKWKIKMLDKKVLKNLFRETPIKKAPFSTTKTTSFDVDELI